MIAWWVAGALAWAAPADPWTDIPTDVGDDPDGAAILTSDTFVADSDVTVDYVYVVGPGGLQPGDLIRVEDPLFHGIRFSKWGVPFADPLRCGSPDGHVAPGSFVTVSTTGDADVLRTRSTDIAEIHDYAYTEVEVVSGELVQGDEIAVRYGDTSAGADCAHRMPYRAFRAVPWRSYELRGDATTWQAVDPPVFDVVAMDEVAALRALAPSTAATGETVRVKVSAFDPRGNLVDAWAAHVEVEAAYGGASADVEPGDGGFVDLEVALDQPGVHRIAVDVDGEALVTNPIVVTDGAPAARLYWGDIHTHHGHTAIDQDGFRTDTNHEYARDAVALDFSAESMKNPPHEIGGEALWGEFQDTCDELTDDGTYVALLGFEWMGGPFGHHNVYVDTCAAEVPDQSTLAGLEGEGGVYAWAAAAESTWSTRAVVIPHASLHTGYDWEARDNTYRSAVEVYSEWNSSMEPRDDPGSVPEAIRLGNVMGFLAGSDNHDGWMGNPWSYRDDENDDVLSGLAAAWMPQLTREAVIDALRDRTTYGTSGDRIVVGTWVEDADGAVIPMGAVAEAEAPVVKWEIHGTNEIASVAVVGVDVVKGSAFTTWADDAPGGLDVTGEVAIALPEGVQHAVWLEIEQVDGERAWTTPVWLTLPEGKRCGCATPGAAAPGWLALLALAAVRRRRR